MPDQKPKPTPEGELIRRAMVRRKVNAPDVAEAAGITPGRWRHIINGAQPLGGGQYHRVVAPAATLAWMARAVGVTPDELAEAGRGDAADVLRDLLADDSSNDYRDPDTGEVYTDPDERELWSLTRLPAEERRKLIYYVRSERQRQQAEQRRKAG